MAVRYDGSDEMDNEPGWVKLASRPAAYLIASPANHQRLAGASIGSRFDVRLIWHMTYARVELE